jgi:hypothetical protein
MFDLSSHICIRIFSIVQCKAHLTLGFLINRLWYLYSFPWPWLSSSWEVRSWMPAVKPWDSGGDVSEFIQKIRGDYERWMEMMVLNKPTCWLSQPWEDSGRNHGKLWTLETCTTLGRRGHFDYHPSWLLNTTLTDASCHSHCWQLILSFITNCCTGIGWSLYAYIFNPTNKPHEQNTSLKWICLTLLHLAVAMLRSSIVALIPVAPSYSPA